MIAALALIFLAAVTGYAAIPRDVEPSLSGRVGLGFLAGTGIVAMLMFMLSFVPGGWNRAALVASCIAIVLSFVRLREGRHPPVKRDAPARDILSWVPLVMAAIVVAGHGLYATAAPLYESDYLMIWGLKGTLFWSHGSIDWMWLRDAVIYKNHVDYPILIPLLFDAIALLNGAWEDTAIGLLYTAWGAALLLFGEARLRGAFPHAGWLVSLAVVALVPLALSPWIGIGEGPMIAFGGAALLLLREKTVPAADLVAALLLGFAAITKNEGVALMIAVIIAVWVTRGIGAAVRLWPALLIAATWQVPRMALGLSGDLTSGDPLQRLAASLTRLNELGALLIRHSGFGWLFWAALAIGAATTFRNLIDRERLIMLVIMLQVGAYLAAYLVTPHDIGWHVRWSWERLVTHLAFPAVFVVLWWAIGAIERWREGRASRGVSASRPGGASHRGG